MAVGQATPPPSVFFSLLSCGRSLSAAKINLGDRSEKIQHKAVDNIVTALEETWADLRAWIFLPPLITGRNASRRSANQRNRKPKSNFPTFRHFGTGKGGEPAENWKVGFDDFYILYYVYILPLLQPLISRFSANPTFHPTFFLGGKLESWIWASSPLPPQTFSPVRGFKFPCTRVRSSLYGGSPVRPKRFPPAGARGKLKG